MEKFFTNAFNNLTDSERESFYRTVIMQDPSPYAEKLRVEYYSKKFKKMGENVKIGPNVRIVNPEYISVGSGVEIGANVTLIARGKGGITLGDNVLIQERVYLDTQTEEWGYITVNNNSYIGTGATIFGHVGLEMGSHCLIGQNVTLTPYSHKYEDPSRLIVEQGGNMQKVVIGNDVYIGMGVNVMYSGSIGDGSIIGAGSTVVKPIPPYSVAVGSPAKVIKERK
ncbi:MAG: hypothetical protein IKL82_03055 [Clostridia bacterium]|nr:hypothetical protein [Clostridia bacterium]